MSRRPTPKPQQAETTNTASEGDERGASGSRALTVNVPAHVLSRAKTRASLESTTMSAVVTQALAAYAEGLKDVLGKLGLDKSGR